MSEVISADEFQKLTRPLVGMRLSKVWRGFGSAVFFEFGKLNLNGTRRGKGEGTAMVEWSWRVEKVRSVMFGSFSGERKIANGLQSLVSRKILDVVVEGRLPEIIIHLSGGLFIHSFTTMEGHPEWTLFLPSNICLSSRLGRLEKEECAAGAIIEKFDSAAR
jgi:hypothetical protein